MLADLRFALRQLRKSPGFLLTAVLTLALGIGATTAIFTLVNAVMLKSLPVVKPEELYRIGDKVHCCMWGGYTQSEEFSLFNYELYKHFRDETPAFTDLAAVQGGNQGLGVRREGSQGPAEQRNSQFVSGNYFRTFGIGAWSGRVLSEADDREGAPPVAVMSYRVWQEKYGADPSVVGAAFQFNGKPFTVVGIAPPGFYGSGLRSWGNPDFWIPLSNEPLLQGSSSLLKQANANWLDVIGRARPGTDPKALESQLRLELRQWQTSHLSDMSRQEKEFLPRQELHLTPGGAGMADMRQQYRDGLRLLLIAASCVLLIACANLANLLLARGLGTRQQSSVRVALGASRIRMVRKALVESVALGLLGGTAGLLVAYAGTSLILHITFPATNNYVPIDAAPSWPVLLFALVVSVATGIGFGVAPAWLASRAQPIEALRGANRSTAGRTSLPQKALVVTQAALSLVLLSAAIMLSQSMSNMVHQNFGFDEKDRYVAWVDPMMAGYQPDQLDNLYERIEQRMQQIPGVQKVVVAAYAPMSGDNWSTTVRIEGKPEPHIDDKTSAGFVRAMPGFFETLGIPVLMGRPFTEEDTPSSQNVAVINQAFAKQFFKDENPIGRHFGSGANMKHSGDYEIVGVVANARFSDYDLKEPLAPMFFLPENQSVRYDKPEEINGERRGHYLSQIIFWAPGRHSGLEMQVRRALSEINPNLTVAT